MGKPPYSVLLGVAAIVAAGAVRHLVAADDSSAPRPIVVVVDDRADVHPAVLDRATKEAGRIYLQAGVKTIWSKAATRSSESTAVQDLSTHGFTVNLVHPGQVSWSPWRLDLPDGRHAADVAEVWRDRLRVSGPGPWILQHSTGRVGAGPGDCGRARKRPSRHAAARTLGRRIDACGVGLRRRERASFGLLLFSSSDSSTVRETLHSCR